MNNLKTEISLVLSKYNDIEDVTELITLLNKEFNKNYSEEDLLNYYVNLTELEIENRKINNYGHFYEPGELNFE